MKLTYQNLCVLKAIDVREAAGHGRGLDVVHLERNGGRVVAAATDGKTLATIRWQDDGADMSVSLTADSVKPAMTAARKAATFVLHEETLNGKAELSWGDGAGMMAVTTSDRCYPSLESTMCDIDETKPAATTVVDIARLERACAAMRSMLPDGHHGFVGLSISPKAGGPIHLWAHGEARVDVMLLGCREGTSS